MAIWIYAVFLNYNIFTRSSGSAKIKIAMQLYMHRRVNFKKGNRKHNFFSFPKPDETNQVILRSNYKLWLIKYKLEVRSFLNSIFATVIRKPTMLMTTKTSENTFMLLICHARIFCRTRGSEHCRLVRSRCPFVWSNCRWLRNLFIKPILTY